MCVLCCMSVNVYICVNEFTCACAGMYKCVHDYMCVDVCACIIGACACGVCLCTCVCSCEFMRSVACCSDSDSFVRSELGNGRFEFVSVMNPIH